MGNPPKATTFRSIARDYGLRLAVPLPQDWPLEQWFASVVDTP